MAYAFNDDKTKVRIIKASGSISLHGGADGTIEIDLTQNYGIPQSDVSKVHILGVMQSVSPNATWYSSVRTTQYGVYPRAAVVDGGMTSASSDHAVVNIAVYNAGEDDVTVYGKAVLMILN